MLSESFSYCSAHSVETKKKKINIFHPYSAGLLSVACSLSAGGHNRSSKNTLKTNFFYSLKVSNESGKVKKFWTNPFFHGEIAI